MKSIFLGLAFILALVVSVPASAQTFPVTVICSSSGQTCTPLYSTPVTVVGGPITLSFTASAAGCSNAQFIFSVDGTQVFTSAFL